MLENEMVRMFALRDRIKALAAEQKLLKQARKTKMPKDRWEAIRKELGRDRDWAPQYAAYEADANTLRITACLNLYHEIRGSEYRHNAEGYYYEKRLKEEREALLAAIHQC
jgi:hypothetical protein